MQDLWQDNAAIAARPSPEEGDSLPIGAGAGFSAAWNEGQLFSNSLSQENARNRALDEFSDKVKAAGGNLDAEYARRITYSPDGAMIPAPSSLDVVNDALTGLKAKNPGLPIDPMSDDDLDRRAAELSRDANQAYAKTSAGEKTFGGKIGMFAGGLASSLSDPLNLAIAPVAPEAEAGILAHALFFGVGAGISQGTNELLGANFREQVQPGYLGSGAPFGNIAENALGGAVFGGGIKALGNLWTRVKTGAWPTSVRDAGNIVESEANLQDSNVLPGVEGEAAHYGAMQTAIAQILRGDPVDVAPFVSGNELSRVSEEVELRQRSNELAAQIAGLPEGDLSAGDRLNRLDAVERQLAAAPDAATKKALNERRDQILVDTNPDALRAAYAPIEQRTAAEREQTNIGARLQDIASERAQERAGNTLSPGALPPADIGQSMPVPAAVREFAAGMPPASEPSIQPQPRLHSSTEMQETIGTPEHNLAMRADIERAIDNGAKEGKMPQVPVGVDADGEPIYKSVARALDEADSYKMLGDQVAACAASGAGAAEE